MKKLFSKKALGYIALAMVCVMAGAALGTAQPKAQADTVVLTSPFTDAVAKVRGSVVGVNNYQLVNYNNYGGGNYTNPWDYFFGGGFGGYGGGYGYGYGNGNGRGNQEAPKEVQYASGSGVVVAEHYVLTNYHVVEDASSLKISVTTDGNTEPTLYEAEVAASDPDLDVAVLYAKDLNLAPVELGDSDTLLIGDWAICIGNPLGFTGTVTTGVISGLDREVEGSSTKTDKYGRTAAVKNTMIQTDAAINNGISGGGMFNTAGQLVGIPTLKYSGVRTSMSGAYAENIGMCIPINEAKEIIEEALSADLSDGEDEDAVTREDEMDTRSDLKGKPRMGVTVTNLNGTNGMLPNGAYVISVDPGSPAEKAGMLAGDIVVEINGEVIGSVADMTKLISDLEEGTELNVKVFRPSVVTDAENIRISTEGDYTDLTVTLAVIDPTPQQH